MTSALSVTQIRVAPKGTVSVAAYGTALPTQVTAPLNASFQEFGYLDESGVSLTPGMDTSGIKAWQSTSDVKTVITGANLDAKIKMIQITKLTTGEFFFGASWTNAGNQGKLIIPSSPNLQERSMVIDWTDDQLAHYRLVLDRGLYSDRDALSLTKSDATAWGVTFHVEDNNGELGYLLTDNLDLIPST